MQETPFELAHAFTSHWEGGLTDHPADPGGVTKYGVSLRWVQSLVEQARAECQAAACSCADCRDHGTHCCAAGEYDFDMDGDVDADDIRACTKAEAARLFKKHFWDAAHCDALPLPLSIVLYDSAVNLGLPRASTLLQQSLNLVGEAQLNEFTELREDGIIGPRTLELAEAISEADLAQYTARRMVALRERFYQRLAASRPSLKVFLAGWKNRCSALLQYLAERERA